MIWRIVLALVVAYLVLSIGPWLVLVAVNALMRRRDLAPDDEAQRLRELQDFEDRQAGRWPVLPRGGRYEAHDRAAQQHRTALSAALHEANTLWPKLASFVPYQTQWTDALLMKAWQPMREAMPALHYLQALRRALDRAQAAARGLHDEQEAVRAIPGQVRGELGQLRAELSRLQTVSEAEREAGTQGLDPFDERLAALGTEVEAALDQLADAQGVDISQVVAEVDSVLAVVRPQVVEVDGMVSRAAEERAQARAVIERMHSALGLAQERWEGLKTRGAREPAVDQALKEMGGMIAAPQRLLEQHTLDAYRQITQDVQHYDTRFQQLMGEMDALQDLIERSRAAVEGDIRAVSEVQAQCDQIIKTHAMLDPDVSLDHIDKATEVYLEAEKQRSLGTRAGYENALTLAQDAMQRLAEAHDAAALFPEEARQLRDLVSLYSPDGLDDLLSRLEHVHEQLRSYPRHWNDELVELTKQCGADIEQVQQTAKRMPPNVRDLQLLRQSEVQDCLAQLRDGKRHLESAEENVARLEGEHARILDLQSRFEAELDAFVHQTLPEALAAGDQMTPELQQRMTRLQESVMLGAAAFENPAQVNYDQALHEWLPAAQHTLQEILSEHESSLSYYGGLAQEAVRRIDKAWDRVSRLDPQQKPGPEQDVERLAADLDAWRAEADEHADEPLVLREIVRRASGLEQRIEALTREVTDERKALEGLSRDYARQAQIVEGVRSAISGLQARSAWKQLQWSLEVPEEAWEQSRSLAAASPGAETFAEARNLLQQALTAASQAQQLYRRSEDEIAGALSRLDDETAAIQSRMRRAERWTVDLRAQGSAEDLAEVERAMDRAQQEAEAARASDGFEEALRHLREASNALTRVLGM